MLLSWLLIVSLFGIMWLLLQRQVFPCQKPILYSIGSVDPRFGLSDQEFTQAAEAAAGIWNAAGHGTLLELADDGGIVVSAVYDQRQAARNKLKDLTRLLTADKESIETLQQSYDEAFKEYRAAYALYAQLRSSYDALSATYKVQLQAAQEQGMTYEDVQVFLKEQNRINTLGQKVNAQQATTSDLVSRVNALAMKLNELAAVGQASMGQYAEADATLGQEFQEGEHVKDANGERITVYSFDDTTELLRLLTHEFGHALGLDHLPDPSAVMYYLNYGKKSELSTADLDALDVVCRPPAQQMWQGIANWMQAGAAKTPQN